MIHTKELIDSIEDELRYTRLHEGESNDTYYLSFAFGEHRTFNGRIRAVGELTREEDTHAWTGSITWWAEDAVLSDEAGEEVNLNTKTIRGVLIL